MKMPRGDGMLLRFGTALTLIPFLVAVVWLPALRLGFVALVAALVLLGAHEFFKMARQAGIEVAPRSGTILAVALALSAGFAPNDGFAHHAALTLSVFLLISIHLFSLRHTIAGLSTSVFGLIYVGYCGSFFIALHQKELVGPALITILIVTIGCSDTGAYLIGKALGRHKLAPKISPNKTIEGSIAAVVCATSAGAVLFGLQRYCGWKSYPQWPVGLYMMTGLCLSIVGQMGDLVESLLKRNAGIKDSGSVFPGHGGALDRCDAFLFGAPALYYLARLVERWIH